MLRYILTLTLSTIALAAAPAAQEKIQLTTPIAKPTIADYKPGVLTIDTRAPGAPKIYILIIATDGTEATFEYPCLNGCAALDTAAEVIAAIDALNSKANMVTRKLWQRVFDFLIRDFPERFPGGATVQ